MTTTRIELAIEQTEIDESIDSYTCDDIRTAWLCTELNRSRAGVGGSFEALWIDR